MDLDSCSVSGSNSSSSSPSSAAAADRMVLIELEAAEALADLAHLVTRESGGGDSAGKWGSKGKRGKKRVKSESPPGGDSVSTFSDPATDQAVVDEKHEHGKPICENVAIHPAKAEPEADLPKQSPASCARSYPSYGGGRSKQNPTEAEKEARRLRRILANRESARQTIRRRQALCEELTRKAADLTWVNENLKREKELVLKEYQSLETTNRLLKAQMAKIIKTEVKEPPADLKSAHVEMPITAATNCPLFLYNQHHFSPLCWPSIIQSAIPVQSQHGPQNSVVIPLNIPMPNNGKLDSSHQLQENPINVNGPRAPLYMVSYPCFFPVPEHGNGSHSQPSFGVKHVQDGTSVNNCCSGGSSKAAAALTQSQHSSSLAKVKLEDASSTEVSIVNDLNETLVGFPLDGGGQCAGLHPKEIAGPHPKEITFTALPLSTVTPRLIIKSEMGPQSRYSPSANGICTKACQLISALPEKTQEPFKFSSKKLVDAVAAAEARRKRKELTKLKNLHGRQCRTNC